jgi:hypothetical protein
MIELAACSHNYAVEKGISFCLECGKFEDYLDLSEEQLELITEGGANA